MFSWGIERDQRHETGQWRTHWNSKDYQDKVFTFGLSFFFDQKCNLWFAMELPVNVNTAHGLKSVSLRGLNQQENTCLKSNVKRLIHYAVYCDY